MSSTDAPVDVVAVNHIGVSVRSLARARRFWVEGLGASEHGHFGWPVGTGPADESLATRDTAADVDLLRTDAAFLELFEFTSPEPSVRPSNAPGVNAVTWAVPDVRAGVRQAVAAGGADHGADIVLCPDGTPVRLVHAGDGPTGLVGIEVQVSDADAFGWRVTSGGVLMCVTGGATDVVPAAVDLGVNHICLDVADAGLARVAGESRTAWHHPVTESSGGLAAVCYGTTQDGVLVELLESRSAEAFFSRARLSHP